MSHCVQEIRVIGRDSEVERLQDLVLQRVGRRLRGFEIVCDEDAIVLRGWAPSFYIKQITQQAVMEATNLPIRANEIEVG
ncbi:hypothetical protein AYO40_04290 [Planctomycetaceae bacterium SCGC AG-212-D15]|nr:hypothetical protein AYO40_04290 [Planctomycetaceae bacterium SCGC AG-212-D15]